MNTDSKKNIFFILYLIIVMVLAVIYFSVPERKEFLEFQIRWWSEFLDVIGSLFK